MKRLILDTDMDTDCDDAGAMALLHHCVAQGECDLIGVVCSIPVPACAQTVYAINAAYGRPLIPIGILPEAELSEASWELYRTHRNRLASGQAPVFLYNAGIAESFPGEPPSEDAVSLYRRLLAESPDSSVTICAIGTLTVLARLLDSAPDKYSPLSGRDLVRQKVAELVSMAVVRFPEGKEEFNWRMDWAAAVRVVNDWPTEITISPHGHHVMTGPRFAEAAPKNHPVRTAYATFLGDETKLRPSWDQIAALYAVRGLTAPFAKSGGYSVTVDSETRTHRWIPATGSPRYIVLPLLPDKSLAVLIEDLMIASLTIGKA